MQSKDEGAFTARIVLVGDIERFIRFVRIDETTGCWNWAGAHDKRKGKEYAKFWWRGNQRPAHQFSYEAFRGPVPVGHEPDHLCRNIGCVNPDHLEAVTRRVNLLRATSPVAINAAKLHCKYGHLFDKANTAIASGARRCKKCDVRRATEYYQRNREKVHARRRRQYAISR